MTYFIKKFTMQVSLKSISFRTFNVVIPAALLVILLNQSVIAAEPLEAFAQINGCTDANITGFGVLTEQITKDGIKEVKIGMQVKGLAPYKKHVVQKHAVHIHETASCQPCSSAKGHFDPGPGSNTSPDGNHPFHSGDLVNLVVDDQGVGSMQTITTRVTLSRGPLSLFDADGSAFIVHVDPDTYCSGGVQVGCAGGARAACGIIKLVQQAKQQGGCQQVPDSEAVDNDFSTICQK